eukprot:735722-Prymnesium_polylepis.1
MRGRCRTVVEPIVRAAVGARLILSEPPPPRRTRRVGARERVAGGAVVHAPPEVVQRAIALEGQ